MGSFRDLKHISVMKMTSPLILRAVAIGSVAAVLGAMALGSERSVGYGAVRVSQPAAAPQLEPDLQQRLTGLRASLNIEPAQEAGWALFTRRMLDLDDASRRLESGADRPAVNAADEKARHALLFAVALSEVDSALSTRQSALLQREARSLGSSFICAETVQKGS
jgi:cytochrome c-type biogenesis protein CcmH/NrfG